MSVPFWLHLLAILSLSLAILCALWVLLDLYRRPQPMTIMNLVWPLTMLWAGVPGLLLYHRIGRVAKGGAKHHAHGQRPFHQSVMLGASHCGSGCTLGDLLAETLVIAVPVSLFGQRIFGTWAVDFVLAFLLGIVFQYFSIKPMRQLSRWQGLKAAVKADTLSLLAWQVGMYGWMALCLFGLFSEAALPKSEPVFWFMMQLAMYAGFIISCPVNAWLIKRGVKEAM
ncbi:DUF4396 domain-containing protein [Pseudomonas rhizoryzae]|uniref:DUF4396 domain-containing protein n=1 Tax=Pseudomonas rhizoryzae TaxID=2571129 RepID=UPI000736564D|nr:DUF4396 domain-containing protein [Pseudomonas rhizoryzae]KTT35003.1 membrane protein [Pseudomonas psychrotolerans]KTT77303.1 membrane protein [Pseudomonas psychrotolerans]